MKKIVWFMLTMMFLLMLMGISGKAWGQDLQDPKMQKQIDKNVEYQKFKNESIQAIETVLSRGAEAKLNNGKPINIDDFTRYASKNFDTPDSRGRTFAWYGSDMARALKPYATRIDEYNKKVYELIAQEQAEKDKQPPNGGDDAVFLMESASYYLDFDKRAVKGERYVIEFIYRTNIILVALTDNTALDDRTYDKAKNLLAHYSRIVDYSLSKGYCSKETALEFKLRIAEFDSKLRDAHDRFNRR